MTYSGTRDEFPRDGRSRRGRSQVGQRRRLRDLPRESRSLRLSRNRDIVKNFLLQLRRSDGGRPPWNQRIREGGEAYPRRGNDTREASRDYPGDGEMARTTFRQRNRHPRPLRLPNPTEAPHTIQGRKGNHYRHSLPQTNPEVGGARDPRRRHHVPQSGTHPSPLTPAPGSACEEMNESGEEEKGWMMVRRRGRKSTPQVRRPVDPRREGQCFRCLAHDHIAQACRGSIRCWLCRQQGHRNASCSLKQQTSMSATGQRVDATGLNACLVGEVRGGDTPSPEQLLNGLKSLIQEGTNPECHYLVSRD